MSRFHSRTLFKAGGRATAGRHRSIVCHGRRHGGRFITRFFRSAHLYLAGAAFLFLGPLALRTTVASCQDERQSGPSQVVVLQSGRILEGEVSQRGRDYLIELGVGNQVVVSRQRVMLVAKSRMDAYLQRRSLLRAGSLESHLSLADWCLQYGLINACGEQLALCFQIAPTDSRLKSLESRLRIASRDQASTSQELSIAVPETRQRLEQLMATLPPVAIETFTSKLQPWFQNRCGAGRCHGPNANSEFRLFAAVRGGNLPRVFTQRNLETVLRFAEARPAEQTRLWKSLQVDSGLEAHRNGAWTQEEAMLGLLRHWLNDVTRPNEPPARLESPDPLLAAPPQGRGTGLPAVRKQTATQTNSTPTVRRTGAVEPLAAGLSSGKTVQEALAELDAADSGAGVGEGGPLTEPGGLDPGMVRRASQLPGLGPRSDQRRQLSGDPFDPAPFNRRFHAERFRKLQQEQQRTPFEKLEPHTDVSAPRDAGPEAPELK